MNDNIICHKCGTENEQEYDYCKNCGASLKPETSNDESQYNYSQDKENTYHREDVLESIDGVPTEDIAIFASRSSSIMKKLQIMEITKSNKSWCWPTAIMGFFFGPIGAAMWFFYRKMYKIAFTFLAIGVLINAATGVVYEVALSDNAKALFEENNYQDFDYDDYYFSSETQEDIFNFASEFAARTVLTFFVNSVVNIATMIVAGLFGLYWYKQHAVQKITGYRNTSPDPHYYKTGLAAIGGTSTGMAVVGAIIYIVSQQIIDVIAALIYLI